MRNEQRKEPGLDRPWEEHTALTEESARLTFDLLKHIATLSAGSVLAAPVVLLTAFPNPQGLWLIIIALICLLIAVASSAVSNMWAITLRTPPKIKEGDADYWQRLWNRRAFYRLFLAAIVNFVLGILFFVLFAIANLFSI